MTAARKRELVSVDDYLAAELRSPVKHEYLGGILYAVAGASNAHNIIAGNTFAAAHGRLRGQPCWVFNSDTKVRVRTRGQVRFYYPDASLVCQPNPLSDSFQDEPVAIFEVLSRATRRIDEGEKKDVYLTIPSLRVYGLIEQETPLVVVFRRTADGFAREVHAGLDAVLPLGEIGIELPLRELYEDIVFLPEPGDDELGLG